MKTIKINDQFITIKDYHCSDGTGYLPREDGKLWLYVNLTDVCNGHCAFCINPGRKSGTSPLDLAEFKKTLLFIKDHVYGISITGGEPMLEPMLIDKAIGIVREVFPGNEEIDIVTNGNRFVDILNLRYLNQLDSIHLSRHRLSDEENDVLFGFHTVTWDELKDTLFRMDDPGAVVLNCVLMKGGIETAEQVEWYLRKALTAGVRNVSFIGMSICNRYCEEHYVDPYDLKLENRDRFHIWSNYNDHGFCSCMSGNYESNSGSIRFYIRGMGNGSIPGYTRQLVYTADNRLLKGFGGEAISLSDE